MKGWDTCSNTLVPFRCTLLYRSSWAANGFWGLGVPLMPPHVQVGTSLVGIKCLGLRRKTWELANSRKTPLKSTLSTQCWPTHTASKGHSSPSWYAQLDCLNAMHRNRAKSCWDSTILGCPAHDNTLMWDLMHASFAWKPTWTFAGITRLLWSKFVLDTNDCFCPDPTPSKHETATICNLDRIQQL